MEIRSMDTLEQTSREHQIEIEETDTPFEGPFPPPQNDLIAPTKSELQEARQ